MALPVYLHGAPQPTIVGYANRNSDGTIEIALNPYLPKDLKEAFDTNMFAYSISYIDSEPVEVIAYDPRPKAVPEKEI